jgi:glycerate 2-kinase
MPRRIVFAPDSFKGTISAADAAAALAEGWRSVSPSDELVLLPMADGGEGTLDAVSRARLGARRVPVRVTGPDDRPVDAHWLLLTEPDGSHTAVIELACASGLTLLHELRPLDAHTLGFGQAITAALDHGVDRLVLALGGSASTDGGSGVLEALGARPLDAASSPVARGARGLASVAHIDADALRLPPAGGAVILADVDNPLLGPRGAAAVFGPQKGLDSADQPAAEAALARWASLWPEVSPEHPGAGAAGGTAFGLLAWGATLRPGSAAIAELLGLEGVIAGADLVITGEGRFDDQTGAGKAPAHVAALADRAGVPCALVAGSAPAGDSGNSGYTGAFAHVVSLTQLAGSEAAARDDPARWLQRAGAVLAAT